MKVTSWQFGLNDRNGKFMPATGWLHWTGSGGAPPTITHVSQGAASPGVSVTIEGTNLSGAHVTFGGEAASVVSDSSTAITVKVPWKAKKGPLFVETAGGTTSSPFTVSAGGSSAIVGVVGNEEVFARDRKGNLEQDFYSTSSGKWSGWLSLGAPSGTTLASDPTAIVGVVGNEEVFVRDAAGNLEQAFYSTSSGKWSWFSLGAPSGTTLASDPTAIVGVVGNEEVFARDASGNLEQAFYSPSGGPWSWASLGAPEGFPKVAPSATTGEAVSVSPVAEKLSGTVNPNGEPVTECRLEYGLTTPYGSSVPCSPSPGEGESAVAVWAAIAGLTPATEYHFRVVAVGPGGTAYGEDKTFTTLPLTAPESTIRGLSQNGGATSGPTPSHSVLAGKSRRSASLLSRALAKCRKIKNHHNRARCIARAKKHYGPEHSHLGGRAKGRR
jgi:roadblock/LC7 domain-containing protein